MQLRDVQRGAQAGEGEAGGMDAEQAQHGVVGQLVEERGQQQRRQQRGGVGEQQKKRRRQQRGGPDADGEITGTAHSRWD